MFCDEDREDGFHFLDSPLYNPYFHHEREYYDDSKFSEANPQYKIDKLDDMYPHMQAYEETNNDLFLCMKGEIEEPCEHCGDSTHWYYIHFHIPICSEYCLCQISENIADINEPFFISWEMEEEEELTEEEFIELVENGQIIFDPSWDDDDDYIEAN